MDAPRTSGTYAAPSNPSRRWLALCLVAVLIAALAIGWLTKRWFLNPEPSLPTRADAIVVLAGGTGERLPQALELMTADRAGTLLISSGGRDWTKPRNVVLPIRQLCEAGSPDFPVICEWPDPDSTRGEAITFARLAKQQGWSSLIVVTSDYHLHRSMMWFERCFDGKVFGMPATSEKTLRLIVHEWLGLVAQSTIETSCKT